MECKNCGHEIGEFSKNGKTNWQWKHTGKIGTLATYADKNCNHCGCIKPEPKEGRRKKKDGKRIIKRPKENLVATCN